MPDGHKSFHIICFRDEWAEIIKETVRFSLRRRFNVRTNGRRKNK